MDKVFVKLGGSIITRKKKAYTENPEAIRRLGKEIKKALTDKKTSLFLIHGGGSYPHVPAKKYGVKKGIVDEKTKKGFLLTHDAAAQINRIVTKILLKEGLPVVSLAPSMLYECRDGKIVYFNDKPLKNATRLGLIPLFYGDIVFDQKKGCTILSGEKQIQYLAPRLGVKKVIMCTDVDGVLNESKKTIPIITPENFGETKKHLGGSAATDVTGGMLHKVEELLKMAQKGISCRIINAGKKQQLYQAMLGKPVGTLITKN